MYQQAQQAAGAAGGEGNKGGTADGGSEPQPDNVVDADYALLTRINKIKIKFCGTPSCRKNFADDCC